MPNDDTHKLPPATDAPKDTLPGWLGKFSHGFHILKGLSLVTVLSSLVVGYFQYLNAYHEKVSSQAKEDMTSATATYTEISHAFSEVHALQQTLYADFRQAVRNKSDGSKQALETKNAQEISKRYEAAWIELRENVDLLTRKAEVYIDWPSNTYRIPSEHRNIGEDPLSHQVLRDYAFDCSDKYNFPAFGNVNAKEPAKSAKDVEDDKYCAVAEKRGVDENTRPEQAFIRICTGPNDKAGKRIYWLSTKHHVLTMNYCFEAVHNKLAAARQWASESDRDTAKESDLLQREKEINAQLDDLAGRVGAFSSLALHQMERIRVKYHPAGFLCSVPLVRNIMSGSCLPIRTASNDTLYRINAVAQL